MGNPATFACALAVIGTMLFLTEHYVPLAAALPATPLVEHGENDEVARTGVAAGIPLAENTGDKHGRLDSDDFFGVGMGAAKGVGALFVEERRIFSEERCRGPQLLRKSAHFESGGCGTEARTEYFPSFFRLRIDKFSQHASFDW